MAISAKLEKAINDQINAEFYSAYLYLSMSCQAQELKLKGVAHWFDIQYQEEVAHAMGFVTYLQERGGRVILRTIEGPQTEWKDAVEMYQTTCEHEAKVTSLINNLASMAVEEKDFALSQFLNWYVKEQVEEEATADEILGEMKLAANAPGAMLMLDRELAARVFNPPVIA
ncbi:MAG: ferritin [Thermoguttaceae bacterium]|nr:ferritin [Thermoguttaceae bacterium]